MLISVSPGKVDLYGLVSIRSNCLCGLWAQEVGALTAGAGCLARKAVQRPEDAPAEPAAADGPGSVRQGAALAERPRSALVQPACASHPAAAPLRSATPLISAPTCASGRARSSGRWNGRSTRRSCPAHRCRRSGSNVGAGMHLGGSPGRQLGA